MTDQRPASLDVSFKKSTIVRSFSSARRRALAATSRWAPGLVARLFERRLFTPQRQPAAAAEIAALDGAERFTIGLPGRPQFAAWSWAATPDTSSRDADRRPPTVLLVHGWAGRGSQLGALAPALTDRGYRVITFDAPGHGASAGRRSSVPMMADAIVEVAAWVGGIDAVIAHSAGAAATTLAIDRGLSVRRAVFVAPVEDISAITERHAMSSGLGREVVMRIRARSERWLGIAWSALRISEMAPARRLPLLVVHDLDDRQVPATHSQRIVRAWKDAALVTTRGFGHQRILRQPAVVERVTRFVTAGEAGAVSHRLSRRQRRAS